MANPFTRLFAYPILERELNNRIADRDATIADLHLRIDDLETRLFVRFGLPPKGVDLSSSKQGVMIPPYRTGRQRVRDMVTPQIATLSPEEEKMMDEAVTQ